MVVALKAMVIFLAMIGLYMLALQFHINLCYIILKRGNRHSNSIMKELRKLMGLPRATSENVHVINLS